MKFKEGEKSTFQKRVILVVGAYRNGTSVLTKGLSTMGVLLTSPSSEVFQEHNPKGDWEDLQFQAINNKLLNSLHIREYRFRNILPVTKEETDFLIDQGYLAEASHLLSQKISDSQLLGIKYPMATLLLPFWKRVFKELHLDVSFVIALREPISAVASMTAYKKQPPEKSFWVWISFLLSSLEYSKGYQRVLVDYHQLLKDPKAQMRKIAHELTLEIQYDLLEEYCNHFIDPILSHFPPLSVAFDRNNSSYEGQEHFGRNFSLEIYQQLLAVANNEVSLTSLEPFLQKWKKQFSSAHSLLCLTEHHEFMVRDIARRLSIEINQLKDTINTMIAEKAKIP